MSAPMLPTPRPYPPLLHGRYPLLCYYGGSDPDRSFYHRPWFPDSCHSNFQPFHLQTSADLCWTRPLPLRQQHYFVRTSPLIRWLVRIRRPKRVHILLNVRGCRYGLVVHFQLLSTRGYRPGAVTFSCWLYSVSQVRDSHPAVQVHFQAHVSQAASLRAVRTRTPLSNVRPQRSYLTPRPTGSRRYGRLAACARTLVHLPGFTESIRAEVCVQIEIL